MADVSSATLDRRGAAAESTSSARGRSPDVALIASEFLAGFQAVQRIDRPAVSIFGSARVREGLRRTSARVPAGAFAERASPSSPGADRA